MKYEVGLNNKSVLFDSGSFDTLEDAINFSRDRGGIYSVNISSGDPTGYDYHNIHLSYNSATGKFSHDSGYGWTTIDNDNLINYINQYI